MKRSWVEIDMRQICENARIYRSLLPEGAQIMAVVKADAYGHGDVEVSRALNAQGILLFAVSNLDEAMRLRENGVKGEILILGYTPVTELDRVLRYDVTQTILDEGYAAAALTVLGAKAGMMKAQAAIDTGMNRIGEDADDPEGCERFVRACAKKFHLTGIFTHLCVADTRDPESVAFTREQIRKFEQTADRVKDLELPYIHCMNSAGGLWHVSRCSRIARLGIILYGLKPDASNTLPAGIRPAMEWKSVVAMVKVIHSGETVGYGRTYKAHESREVATIPTGYADGYDRRLSNRGHVIIAGREAPVIGRVCMDQITADVTGMGVHPGDEVLLMGKDTLTADELARDLGTIGYEIVCGIGKRVTRYYV